MKYVVFIFVVVLIVVVTHYEFKLGDKEFEISQIKSEHMHKLVLESHKLDMAKAEYQDMVDEISYKLIIAMEEISELRKDAGVANVILTWYHPESGGINTDGNPYRTATMTKPKVGRTIAISKELVRKGWLGKRIYIEGYGVFVAEDRMSSKLPGCRIDICCASKKIAMRNGKKSNVFCSVLNN
jgi:3D (Asp-Asp-Asp) domain-containing protein